MNSTHRALALFTLAGAAVLPSARGATAVAAYTQGDLLLGFTQAGNSSDVLVDLGPASQFFNATQPFTINFGVKPGTTTVVTSLAADLSAVFGNGNAWAANTGTAVVQWGLVGDTDHFTDGATFGLPANTLFLSHAQTVIGTQSTVLNRFRSGPSGTIDGTIASLNTGQFGYDKSVTTANSSMVVVQPIANANSYANFNPSTNAFGSGFNIQQPASGTNIGPTNSELDLYTLQPATTSGNPGSYDGSFTLGTDGVLTYTPNPVITSVPEPSAGGLLGLASLLQLGILRLRRRRA